MRSVVVLPAPWTHQAEDLALLHGQVDAGDRERSVVALDQIRPDDLAHFSSPVIERSMLNPTPSLLSLTSLIRTVPVAGSTKQAGSAMAYRAPLSKWGRRFHSPRSDRTARARATR